MTGLSLKRSTAICYFPLYILCLVLLAGCGSVPICPPEDSHQGGECVVLLHGLARTNRTMEPLAKALRAEGYRAINLQYTSTEKTIEQIVADGFPRALQCAEKYQCETIHIVTHSMGGIVTRLALQKKTLDNLGRVVMISPPNQGSELAESLNTSWWLGWIYRWRNGPAGEQLGTGTDSVPKQLGPVTYPTGIITGDHHNAADYWFSKIIPGRDDGKVAVEEAKVDGMADFMVVPHHHTSIMKKKVVIEKTISFLRTGSFGSTEKNAP